MAVARGAGRALARRVTVRRYVLKRPPPPLLARRLSPQRRTQLLGITALGTTGTVVGLELARVWQRGSAQMPADAEAPSEVVVAGAEAALQTVEVVHEGYVAATPRENTLLNLLAAYVVTFGLARLSTHRIRTRGRFGPFRNVKIADRHVHHFVPGMTLAFVSGGVSIVSRDARLGQWLALPFGAGLALTLDESALLLRLDDVYWTEEGIVSVQIAATTAAMLGALTLARRLFRRGEARVLGPAAVMDPPR